jgi:hypothetical protein
MVDGEHVNTSENRGKNHCKWGIKMLQVSKDKRHITCAIPNKDGITIYDKISKGISNTRLSKEWKLNVGHVATDKMVNTRNIVVPDGMACFERGAQKGLVTRIESDNILEAAIKTSNTMKKKYQQGMINNNAKEIKIYDAEDKLISTCIG